MDTLLPPKMDTISIALAKATALNHLMKELNVGVTDPICYSEDEVYHIVEVDNRT